MNVANALACTALITVGSAALAQDRTGVRKALYYEGLSPNTPRCPAIRWMLRDTDSEAPSGYVWFTDASGMSKATGESDLSSGLFHLTLVSLDGNGPTGQVTGRKDPKTGSVTADLDGPGCSKLTLGPTNPHFRRADGTD